jgi:integrase
MGRQSENSVSLLDGKITVGYGLTKRTGYFRVRFKSPDGTRYLEYSTGEEKISDARNKAAEIITRAYFPPGAHPVETGWDKALTELDTSSLRPETVRDYRKVISLVRNLLPETAGPADVTLPLALRFRKHYGEGRYRKGKDSTAKEYTRSAVSLKATLRKLRSLWQKHFRTAGYVKQNPWLDVPYPETERKAVKVPPEANVSQFFQWLNQQFPGWVLLRALVEVKALSGCRTWDICQLRSSQLQGNRLTFLASQTKHKRERTIPLPDDLANVLNQMKGETWLWEQYDQDVKRFRPKAQTREGGFDPKRLYNGIANLFKDYNLAHPEAPLKPHDLRRRAITLLAKETGSIDLTATAIGIDPATARRYYLDQKAAFDTDEILTRLAGTLRQPSTAVTAPLPPVPGIV